MRQILRLICNAQGGVNTSPFLFSGIFRLYFAENTIRLYSSEVTAVVNEAEFSSLSFHGGTDSHLYEYLGAHVRKCEGVEGVNGLGLPAGDEESWRRRYLGDGTVFKLVFLRGPL